MPTSVIVSTYNAPRWLEKALIGWACQDRTDFEVIVADDGSGPETKALIDRLAGDYPVALRHLWQEDRGFRKNAILNRAILAAAGDYLLFTDGDCIPRADCLAAHLRHAAAGRFLSAGYCRLPMTTSQAIGEADIRAQRCFAVAWLRRHGFSSTPKWLKIVARPWRIDGLLNTITPAKATFNGNNSSCFRRDAIAVGGFDERMGYGGEDREFGYRLANAGVRPRIIRYSALCLHLDHARGYRDDTVRAANEAIINETLKTGRTRTEHGLPAG
ncbi:MAG: hypothetical protein BroJett030_29060 [Alphaproteobacteria bacterium]|nr:MAG: hypothetical protein BroJett030_29060 [Alphaproteobacteria bacterium]